MLPDALHRALAWQAASTPPQSGGDECGSRDLFQARLDSLLRRVLRAGWPERRGNGLKFVRSVVNGGEARALVCQSGGGAVVFGALASALEETSRELRSTAPTGVAAVFAWRTPS